MVENILVGLIVLAAVAIIGRKLWRMRCIRAQRNAEGKDKCNACPGCGPG